MILAIDVITNVLEVLFRYN